MPRTKEPGAVGALREIERAATKPISSMRSEKRQLRERGEEMLAIARRALREVCT